MYIDFLIVLREMAMMSVAYASASASACIFLSLYHRCSWQTVHTVMAL